MTNLTIEQKKEFKSLYKSKFWIILNDEEVLEYSLKLINLIKPILIPNIEE